MQGAEAQMLSNSSHGPLGFGGGGGTHLCPRLFPRLIEGLFARPGRDVAGARGLSQDRSCTGLLCEGEHQFGVALS